MKIFFRDDEPCEVEINTEELLALWNCTQRGVAQVRIKIKHGRRRFMVDLGYLDTKRTFGFENEADPPDTIPAPFSGDGPRY